VERVFYFMKEYLSKISININNKGVIEIDVVKGCSLGMEKYPEGGCYGLCYARKIANRYGYNFSKSISRKFNIKDIKKIIGEFTKHNNSWFRIGVMGDPSHDWKLTLKLCKEVYKYKTPVIVTKHWKEIPKDFLYQFYKYNVVFNTSISALDTPEERVYRLKQFNRLKSYGIKSVLRIVSCAFGQTKEGKKLNEIQNDLFFNKPFIDNPLRISKNDIRVLSGDILINENNISLKNKSTHIGKCANCKDKCGTKKTKKERKMDKQIAMFQKKVEFEYLESIIGSGYEEDVAKLAIEDEVAYRAARKNMQIHSAIILKIDNVFSGFFTFEINHDAKEFCLLQSAMYQDKKDKDIYSDMIQQIIDKNTFGYHMVMTVSRKHDLEKPKVFHDLGFVTYLVKSDFEYMVHGKLSDIRLKLLAHVAMTNLWNSVKGPWLQIKREWNVKIEEAGEKYNIENPKFASREGCWQGSSGFSNVVLSTRTVENNEIKVNKGKSFNGNASVLDPTACEVILRMFMPKGGCRVYNPFGGGVQMGFITGASGFEYMATEIRQNQCDANNALCQDFYNTKWIQADSSTYKPKQKYDLIFSCPPYYRVEKYLDYDGNPPEGEINHLPSYDEFRDTLFAGYKCAIDAMNDNTFFVVMTGDSRDKNGAYYGCES